MRQKKAQELLYHIKKTYNDIASEFSASRQHMCRDFEIFKPYLCSGQRIVDLGCGNGRLISFLKKNLEKFDYLGIDNSEAMLKEARKNHPGYKFIHGDQLELAMLPDNSVDILFSIRAFHHIPSKQLRLDALKEMRRVLKNNGLLILTVWDLWQSKKTKYLLKGIFRWIFTFGRYSYNDTFILWGKEKKSLYYHAFRMNELRNLVKKTGYRVYKNYNDKVLGGSVAKQTKDLVIIAKKINKKVKILDIPFANVNLQQALKTVLERLKKPLEKAFFIATPNPEMLLEARKNSEFKKILQKQTDLNIPDGFGIILASKLQKMPLAERVTGTDFMQALCQNVPGGTKIFLLGAAPGVAKKTKNILEKKYKNIKIVGTHSGSPAPKEEKNICGRINESGAEILFVAFGAPKQELWLAKNLPYLSTIKVAMGVGGAFDFIAGARKRAPAWLQKCGLEWVFRLIQEPKRLKRIYNATVKFPVVLLLKNKK